MLRSPEAEPSVARRGANEETFDDDATRGRD